MRDLWRRLLARVRGDDRRHHPRFHLERVAITDRQYEAARTLATRLGTTPEELLDYRIADRILGRGR